MVIEKTASTVVIDGVVFTNVQFQSFQHICLLGRGSFGVVDKYKFEKFEVAIKVCSFYENMKVVTENYFLQKIRISNIHELKSAFADLGVLQRCQHQHITKYYGYIIDEVNI